MGSTYKMITLVGTAKESYEQAIRNALTDASTSVRNLAWYEVKEMRGSISGGTVGEFQVKILVGLKVETN